MIKLTHSILLSMTVVTLGACASRPPTEAPTLASCVPTIGAADFPNADVKADLAGLSLGKDRVIRTSDRLVYGLRLEQAGEIKDMTGIDSPYEEPEKPELEVDTESHFDECSSQVFDYIKQASCIRVKIAVTGTGYVVLVYRNATGATS